MGESLYSVITYPYKSCLYEKIDIVCLLIGKSKLKKKNISHSSAYKKKKNYQQRVKSEAPNQLICFISIIMSLTNFGSQRKVIVKYNNFQNNQSPY